MAEHGNKRHLDEQNDIIENYEVIAKLEDKDAETFLEYNDRDLTDSELASLQQAHELYKKHSNLNE